MTAVRAEAPRPPLGLAPPLAPVVVAVPPAEAPVDVVRLLRTLTQEISQHAPDGYDCDGRPVRASTAALMRESADELSRARTAFLRVADHELRTPLTSVLGYAEMLAEGDLGELTAEQAAMATKVVDNAGRLLEVIETLLRVGTHVW